MLGALTMVLAVSAFTSVQAGTTDPIEKVLQMISDLESKIIGEGNDAQKVYDEFAEFCEDRSKEVGFEIKTGKAQKKDLEAAIADEADIKAATEIRAKEKSAFDAEEKELM